MKVRVEGLQEAQMMLRELGAGGWSFNVMGRWGRQAFAKAKPYPPMPAGSKYIRTMNLSGQWYSIPEKTQVTIGNRAPYSGYVQQEATQAWFHKGRWQTIEDVASSTEMEQFFAKVVQEEVNKVLRRYG